MPSWTVWPFGFKFSIPIYSNINLVFDQLIDAIHLIWFLIIVIDVGSTYYRPLILTCSRFIIIIISENSLSIIWRLRNRRMGAVYQQFICCIVCSFSGKFKRYSMHVHVFLWLPLVAPFIIVHPRQVPVKVLHLINFYIIKSDWWFDFAILVFFEDGISRRELLRNALY